VLHPPNSPGQRYAHRITAIEADGALRTKGDLNATADPRRLQPGDLSGRVVARLWGIGWLLRALPLLLLGSLVLWRLCRHLVRAREQLPAIALGASLLVAISLLWLRPLVRASVLGLTSDESGAHGSVVGTGLMPIKVHAVAGSSTNLRPGQLGIVRTTQPVTGSPSSRISAYGYGRCWCAAGCSRWPCYWPSACLVAVSRASPTYR
jgi:hypothetical protein